MILLVEDNEDDAFIMERVMTRVPDAQPMHVAINGRDALDYLQAVGKYADRARYPLPTLIFLDLKLPYVHGFEVLEWLRNQPSLSRIPVLILSSSPEERDRDRARELGAKKFLVKPPTVAVVSEMIQLFAAPNGR